jgi:hypothetical protein
VQGTVTVGEKAQSLSLRIAELETIFEAPSDDETEQIRRNELLRYGIVPPLDSRLSSSQQVQGYRRTTTDFIREAKAAAIC